MFSVPNGRLKSFKCLHESWVFKVESIWMKTSWLLKQVSFLLCRLFFSWHLSTWKHPPGRLCKFLRPTLKESLAATDWKSRLNYWIIALFFAFHLFLLFIYCIIFVHRFLICVCVCHVSFAWKVFKISRLLSLCFLFCSLAVFRTLFSTILCVCVCTARSRLKEKTLMKTKYRRNLLRDVR